MSPRKVRLIALRVIRQLRRDRRTVAMIFVVPTVMVVLLGFVLRAGEGKLTLLIAADDPAVQPIATLAAADLPSAIQIESTERGAGYQRLRDGDAEGMLLLRPDGDPRLVLEGTRVPATEALTRFAGQVALLLRTGAGAGGSLPAAGPSLEIEREFIRAGPELDLVDGIAPAFITFFAYFFVFLLTSVAFLRERQQGTLERLMITPIRRLEIISGYMLGFGFFALLQAFVVVTVTILALEIHMYGNLIWVFLAVALVTLGAVNLGILCSTFARNELQVVQFIPLVIVPQALLSGTFLPLGGMPDWIIWFSRAMPMTYAVEAVKAVMVGGSGVSDLVVWRGMLALVAFAIFFILVSARTLRRA